MAIQRIVSMTAVLWLVLFTPCGCSAPDSPGPGTGDAAVVPGTDAGEPGAVASVLSDVPADPDPDRHYLFYLHGRIVELQGAEAVSERFGPYRYNDIVAAFAERGFTVISEVRPRDTDGGEYAKKVAAQIGRLRASGVPPGHITVVGASKGAGIAVLTSHQVADPAVNYVLLAICSPGLVERWRESGICPKGRILSVYDGSDEMAGPCTGFLDDCRDQGVSEFREIVLEKGTGHGIVYEPLPEWVDPVVEWVGQP